MEGRRLETCDVSDFSGFTNHFLGFLERKHIDKHSIYGTYMEHIWNIYGTYMEHIWNIYGTYISGGIFF
jgi:hypothetical protein